MPSDIVILDIGLEGEDGLSIATHLRSSQSVGIIMATARGYVDDRVGGLKRGADAYLVKPLNVRELAVTAIALDERLKRSRTGRWWRRAGCSPMGWAVVFA
ncbi:response regulator [Kaistia granuli]|uniref:response regulator n=1 Tax=Kaistia granuli TaxID=363259 RepID=UPI0006882759|nr:response regulator [Kaistia granuli]